MWPGLMAAAYLFIVLILSGCGGFGSKTTTIKVSFWGDNKEIEIIKSIVEPWAKQHKDIKVVLEHIPVNQYMTK